MGERPQASTVALRAKLSFIVVAIVAAIMVPFGWFTVRDLERAAINEASEDVASVNAVVLNMISANQDGIKIALMRMAGVFRQHFGGKFSLDEQESTVVGGQKVPTLKLDGRPLGVGDRVIAEFTRETGGGVASIFVRSGDDFVRISTSLLKEDGMPALGTALGKDHPAYQKVLLGQSYQGPVRLFGRYFMAEYVPIKDDSGRVIALLFVGMDLTETLHSLLQKTRSLVVGKSGYVFVIDANPGQNYGRFILHPAMQGKSALAEGQEKSIREMLTRREGLISYAWRNPELGETEPRRKIAAFAQYKELGWIVGTSGYVDDFLSPHRQAENRMILTMIFASILGMFALNLAIGRWVIRPMLRLQDDLQAVGQSRRTLINALPDVVRFKDGEGRWLEANKPALEIFDLLGEEFRGKTDAELAAIRASSRQVLLDCRQTDEAAWKAGAITRSEESVAEPGQAQRIFDVIRVPLFHDDGSRNGLVVVGRDITELRRNEAHQRLAARVFETTGEAIMVTDARAQIVMVNPAFCRITGYAEAEVLGKNPHLLFSGYHDQAFYAALWQSLKTSGEWSGEIWNRRRNGEIFPEWQTISSVRDESGQVTHYISVFADLSEIRAAQETAEQLSWHDTLTGLANRALFIKQLDHVLAQAQRDRRFADVLLIDLDRFKDINEARGLGFGDRLLTAVGEHLRRILHADDMLARLDADEFAVMLCRAVADRDVAGRCALLVAERLRKALQGSIEVDGEIIHLDASVGIALFPESPHATAADLLRQADMAVHQAKTMGGGRTVFFEKAMGEAVLARYELERELRQAIADGQLRLYLQSQFDQAGQVVGAEALVRWEHPSRGLIPPGAFIPLAECSDLIVAVDRWILGEVCRLLARQDAVGRSLRIAVNISPRHFSKADFVEVVKRCLADSGADPTHLVLEVTEGLMIDDIADVTAKMTQLTAIGVHFSMDDFGTGYSSLSYLKRLPIHELKIDKSFIDDVPNDANDAALVETILAVAQHLRLQVIAEGVERDSQVEFLQALGPVIYQGYLYGRPVPVQEWLAQQDSREAVAV